MKDKPKLIVSWSGGKDSSLALHEIQQSHKYEIDALITTVTADYDRVSMHGLRISLLDSQVGSLNIPLKKVEISKNASNEEYQSRMKKTLLDYKNQGINTLVFGDLFLEDIKKYREEFLGNIGMECIFPIWGRDTVMLAQEFIDMGFRAITVCVDSKALGKEFAGREFNQRFLNDLPSGIDPCGENGEFHTFVYDGPIFDKPISHEVGEIVLRDERFYYCDILPK